MVRAEGYHGVIAAHQRVNPVRDVAPPAQRSDIINSAGQHPGMQLVAQGVAEIARMIAILGLVDRG